MHATKNKDAAKVNIYASQANSRKTRQKSLTSFPQNTRTQPSLNNTMNYGPKRASNPVYSRMHATLKPRGSNASQNDIFVDKTNK
jgi:hypothetical protein